jgi:ankyrin repeat protein
MVVPDYGKLTVAKLRALCKKKRLPTTGKKDELIARLNEADGESTNTETNLSSQLGKRDKSESENYNEPDPKRSPPLDILAATNVEELEKALESGANIDQESADNLLQTPLHRAVLRGDLESVRFLLSKNANWKKKELFGQTALFLAATSGNVEIFQELLTVSKALVNTKDSSRDTPLSKVAASGNIEIARLLLENNAKINERCNGQTAIHYAAFTGQMEMIKFLIEAKADISSKNQCRGTLLLQFDVLRNVEMTRYLLDHGVKPDLGDDCDSTPLLLCAGDFKCESNQTAQLLLERGANINNRDCDSHTPLYHAVYYNNKDLVQLLLDKNADVHFSNSLCPSLLTCAKSDEVKELLVKFGLTDSTK